MLTRPFCSTWDFYSHWSHLRTPVLSFNGCAGLGPGTAWFSQIIKLGGFSKHQMWPWEPDLHSLRTVWHFRCCNTPWVPPLGTEMLLLQSAWPPTWLIAVRLVHIPLPLPCRQPCSCRVPSSYSSDGRCFSIQSLIEVLLPFWPCNLLPTSCWTQQSFSRNPVNQL